jgi:hypothetical protein
MRFTLGITTRYIDRHPTASMTNNPPVVNQSEHSTSIKLRTTDNVTPHLWIKVEHLCYVLFPGSMIAPQNKI